MRRQLATTRSDRASATVELAILAPLFTMLLGAVVFVGRVQVSRADIESAARSAARDLSIARDPTAATASARQMIDATLDVGSPTCRSLSFEPVITSELVTVRLSCQVDLQAAAMLPVPGSMTVTATATEVIDQHREYVQ